MWIWLVVERTAGPSTSLRSGRDDNFVAGRWLKKSQASPNEQKIKPIESISISGVHFTLNLPQASQLLGMTKGRVALPFVIDAARVNRRALHFAALRGSAALYGLYGIG
jgi:hypothetical protein